MVGRGCPSGDSAIRARHRRPGIAWLASDDARYITGSSDHARRWADVHPLTTGAPHWTTPRPPSPGLAARVQRLEDGARSPGCPAGERDRGRPRRRGCHGHALHRRHGDRPRARVGVPWHRGRSTRRARQAAPEIVGRVTRTMRVRSSSMSTSTAITQPRPVRPRLHQRSRHAKPTAVAHRLHQARAAPLGSEVADRRAALRVRSARTAEPSCSGSASTAASPAASARVRSGPDKSTRAVVKELEVPTGQPRTPVGLDVDLVVVDADELAAGAVGSPLQFAHLERRRRDIIVFADSRCGC